MIKELKVAKSAMRKMRSESLMTLPWTNIWGRAQQVQGQPKGNCAITSLTGPKFQVKLCSFPSNIKG